MATEVKAEAEERSSPGAPVVYEAILEEGMEEVSRPSQELWWSGISAGLAMGASLLAQGILHSYLPDALWRHLLVSFGYTFGFLIVVLGRQQLFTENTLTVVLPFLKRKNGVLLWHMTRVWLLVFAANMVGAWMFAWVLAHTSMFDEHYKHSMSEVSKKGIMVGGIMTVFLRGIVAGWLIALMVWMLPAAESARFFVVTAISYLVGVAGLSHIVAGAVEVFFLVERELMPFWVGVKSFILPALAGNIIGGVTLVAVLAHAQVVGHRKKKKSK